MGDGTTERPRFCCAVVEALGAAARSILCRERWVVCRLGPHCERIELGQFPKHRDEKTILKAMGEETANLHLATFDQRAKVLGDLAKQMPDWLHEAAQAMSQVTEKDWKAFRSAGDGG